MNYDNNLQNNLRISSDDFARPKDNKEYEDQYSLALRLSLEETPESTLEQFAVDREMDEMAIAIDRSLDEHPDFIELQKLAEEESLRYKPESNIVRYFDQSIGKDNKNPGIKMNNTWMELLWKHGDIGRSCLWCNNHNDMCIHMFPSEFRFFFKLRSICKQWRSVVDEWLKMKRFMAISYECDCCSHVFAYKKSKYRNDVHPWNRDIRSVDKNPISACTQLWRNCNGKYNIPTLTNGYNISTSHKECEFRSKKKKESLRK